MYVKLESLGARFELDGDLGLGLCQDRDIVGKFVGGD